MSFKYIVVSVYVLSLSIVISAKLATVISNHAGSPIQVFWKNTFAGNALKEQSNGPVQNGSEISFSSYVNHQFVVMLAPPVNGTEVTLTKGNREETFTIVFDNDAGKLAVKRTTKLDDLMDDANAAHALCAHLTGQEQRRCLEPKLKEANRILESRERFKNQNDAMSTKLREYICNDTTLTSSKPIETVSHIVMEKNLTFEMYLDTPHAKIWSIDKFITGKECRTIHEATDGSFMPATVFAANGSREMSHSRRAKDARYPMAGGTSDPLWSVYQRIIAIVNLKTGYKLATPGQEGFTVIHYDSYDQYMNHCDSLCVGQPHQPRGRVATAVLYCKVAEEGGATTFPRSGVHIKPKAGMATFFSYKGPDGRMDDGSTEHSGCPVIKGEKLIATAWLREGVDNEHPYFGYDAKGFKIPDEVVTPISTVEAAVSGGSLKSEL